jgi:predicted glycosyltransferase
VKPASPSTARVVFQAPNTVGLGHISRLAAIATALRELDPAASMVFAIEGDDHGLLQSTGLPRLSIPGQDLAADAWKGWSRADRLRLTLSLAATVFDTLRPDLVVFDCLPNWAFLEAVRERATPFAICLRKMKERPGEMVVDVLRQASLILLPHTPEEMEMPADLTGKCRYVGSIVRPVRPLAADDVRWRVVITGGGGGFPATVDFYNDALRAVEICRRDDPSLDALLVTGPLFGEWRRLRPVEGVRIVPFEPDLARLFAAADVVVCQGGYNTVAEVVSLGVPAVCVPAPRIFDDQRERARAMAAAHPQVQSCESEGPGELAACLARALTTRRGEAAAVGAPGATRAARALLDLLGRRAVVGVETVAGAAR